MAPGGLSLRAECNRGIDDCFRVPVEISVAAADSR